MANLENVVIFDKIEKKAAQKTWMFPVICSHFSLITVASICDPYII